jgi:hypothetical protein
VLMGLYRTSLGYDPHQMIIASINLPDGSAPTTSYTKWADRATFYERLRNRMADVPDPTSNRSPSPPTAGYHPGRANGRWSMCPDER